MRAPERWSDERLRALASDMVSVVRRHAPEWTGTATGDPGVTLLGLFAWLGDSVASDESLSGEAALATRRRLGAIAHHLLSDAPITVTVDGISWQRWGAPSPGACERTYVVEREGGAATIRFGDGRSGGRLPAAGSEVRASYRVGSGTRGLSIAVRWPPEPLTMPVHVAADRIVFGPPGRRSRILGWISACLGRRGERPAASGHE